MRKDKKEEGEEESHSQYLGLLWCTDSLNNSESKYIPVQAWLLIQQGSESITPTRWASMRGWSCTQQRALLVSTFGRPICSSGIVELSCSSGCP